MTADPEPRAGRAERVAERIERRGVTTSFLWGFSEATLFFFVPDIAVGAAALFGWKRGLKAAGAAVVGAVLGGLVTYAVARGLGEGIRDVLTRLPAIPDRFFGETARTLAEDGGVSLVHAPGRGIPYKLYAAEWAVSGRDPVTLALWTVPARAARIVPAALVSALGARAWRRLFGDDRDGLLLLAYAAVWVAVYAAYFWRVGW